MIGEIAEDDVKRRPFGSPFPREGFPMTQVAQVRERASSSSSCLNSCSPTSVDPSPERATRMGVDLRTGSIELDCLDTRVLILRRGGGLFVFRHATIHLLFAAGMGMGTVERIWNGVLVRGFFFSFSSLNLINMESWISRVRSS